MCFEILLKNADDGNLSSSHTLPEHPVHILKLYFPRASGSHSTVSVSPEQTLPQASVWRRATPLRSSRCCPSLCFISSCFIPCSYIYYSSCYCPCSYCVLIIFRVFCVRSSREELPVASEDLLRIVSDLMGALQ